MSLFVVDVEADGPCPGESYGPLPGDYSMLSFASVRVDKGLSCSFVSNPIKPISGRYRGDAIASIGLTPQTRHSIYVEKGNDPKETMASFESWVLTMSVGRPIFISDNNGFDWMFICYYFHHFLGRNPFGFSSRRLGDLYCGLMKDMRAQWKHLRKTKHTHDPLMDAKGNAEVILYMMDKMGLK